jgi:hypothetical protein
MMYIYPLHDTGLFQNLPPDSDYRNADSGRLRQSWGRRSGLSHRNIVCRPMRVVALPLINEDLEPDTKATSYTDRKEWKGNHGTHLQPGTTLDDKGVYSEV